MLSFSVLNRSPSWLIHEIILVDDYSKNGKFSTYGNMIFPFTSSSAPQYFHNQQQHQNPNASTWWLLCTHDLVTANLHHIMCSMYHIQMFSAFWKKANDGDNLYVLYYKYYDLYYRYRHICPFVNVTNIGKISERWRVFTQCNWCLMGSNVRGSKGYTHRGCSEYDTLHRCIYAILDLNDLIEITISFAGNSHVSCSVVWIQFTYIYCNSVADGTKLTKLPKVRLIRNKQREGKISSMCHPEDMGAFCVSVFATSFIKYICSVKLNNLTYLNPHYTLLLKISSKYGFSK